MCPNTHYATLRNKLYDGQTKIDVSKIFQRLLYFARFVNWDIVLEDESLSSKARNGLGLNEFEKLVYIVDTKCDIVCNDSFTTHLQPPKIKFNPFELDKFVGMFVLNEPFKIDMSNVN